MIEIINKGASASKARVALFDFDGTLSTIRSGWVDVMVPMMVELLYDLKTGETEEQLRAVVDDFVAPAHRKADGLSDDRTGRPD